MDTTDIALEAKQELAEKAAECLMEFGAVTKFVVLNSAFHEVRFPSSPPLSLQYPLC